MRIVRIEGSIVRADLMKPYIKALITTPLTEVHCVVLRLYTDDGLCGIGETDPEATFSDESPESVLQVMRQYLGPAVLGMDPGELVTLHTRMDTVLVGSPFAKAPFDMAAHDLLGKALGVPVYQLLGGRVRDRVPLLWPIGSGTPAENVRDAVSKVKEGYRCLGMKVAALEPEQDVARIRAIREAVGPDVSLIVDANGGWDVSTAIRTIRQLQEFELSVVEQPVPAWDLEGMAKVQAAVDVPVSADESLHSFHTALELIRRDAARVFSVKNTKCGGILRSRQVATIAEAAGLRCFVNAQIEMGISVAASLHLAASVPNLIAAGQAVMSNLRIKEDILLPNCFKYDGTDILVPDECVGLGVVIDEKKLEQRTLERFVVQL
jgi:L-alanine-DL-glutamate epimerase-like enolase superfamily enzyme